MKPTAILAMFSVPQSEKVAQEVEEAILKIMKERRRTNSWSERTLILIFAQPSSDGVVLTALVESIA